MPDKIKGIIADRVELLATVAKKHYAVVLNPTITYNVQGTCAGYAEFDDQVLDFHLGLAEDNKDIFVDQIVGHEFCHLVADAVYAHRGHGSEWKEVMRTFDLQPDRCHKLDVSRYARKPKTFPYACKCNVYEFNSKTHYKLQTGLFECNHCRNMVRYKGTAKDVRQFKAGTRENVLWKTLTEYHRSGIPLEEQLMLLMDSFDVAYSTARTYYYEYRPKL